MADKGKVYFIGAGPGDPELITLRGQRILGAADVIVYTDSLVSPDLLRWANPGARVCGSAGLTLEEIMAVLVESARAGQVVARVHTGDPSVYGAVLEQVVILNREGIPYEIVPGVSSVFAAAAALGAELTVPELAQTVILTRMEGRTPVPPGEKLRDLAAHRTTLVLYLSVTLIGEVVRELLAGGYPPETPAAVVQRASWPDQQIVRGTLADIAARTRAARINSHALILVGAVFDPALPTRGEGYRSRLYDKDFTHRFRSAEHHPLPPGALQQGGLVGAGAKPERYAIVAITRHGTGLGARIQAALPGADLWVPAKFAAAAPAGALTFPASPSRVMAELFQRYTGLIFLVSLGAVVRLIAPHLQDKHLDPAVVVVDDTGQFAIPVLSGHLGGANDLARRVGAALGAQPVITTASDVHQTIAVDLFGRAFGWRIEGWENVTAASAAVVNGEPVAIYQDAGEADWWPADRPLPPGLHRVATLAECAAGAAALVVTDRAEVPAAVRQKAVLYRPRCLVVGVGCNRGTAAAEIRAAVAATLGAHGLSPLAVRNWASIDAKADEEGLLAAAREQGIPLSFFPREQLNAVAVPNPSPAPMRHVGAQGVAEPAALVSAGAGAELVVPKQKHGNCTVAVARIHFPRREPE